jgi:uncharacterized protein (TIGR03435 family)
MRARTAASLLFLASYAASGQSPAASPAFDVASIKPSQLARAGGQGSRRENIQPTPGSLAMHNVTLASAIQWAYQVKPFQISGPSWITNDRFDIDAKSPGGAPETALRLMLQTLLADRFKLAFHRETREIPVYALTVGKAGAKVHHAGKDGDLEVKPGQGGKMNIELRTVSMAQFADFLSTSPLQRPVLDETGLAGKYDLALDLMPYLNTDADGKIPGPVGLSDMGNIIATAIQEQLGLKLESRKESAEVLVVDHAEKTPVEN